MTLAKILHLGKYFSASFSISECQYIYVSMLQQLPYKYN